MEGNGDRDQGSPAGKGLPMRRGPAQIGIIIKELQILGKLLRAIGPRYGDLTPERDRNRAAVSITLKTSTWDT